MQNLGVLVPILALMIPIVAIVMNNWRRVKDRQLDLMERDGATLGGEVEARLGRLEARIQVLERIATDRRPSLAEEIDALAATGLAATRPPSGQETRP